MTHSVGHTMQCRLLLARYAAMPAHAGTRTTEVPARRAATARWAGKRGGCTRSALLDSQPVRHALGSAATAAWFSASVWKCCRKVGASLFSIRCRSVCAAAEDHRQHTFHAQQAALAAAQPTATAPSWALRLHVQRTHQVQLGWDARSAKIQGLSAAAHAMRIGVHATIGWHAQLDV
jgi:hypothetical protein